jgi:hypothetical protein
MDAETRIDKAEALGCTFTVIGETVTVNAPDDKMDAIKALISEIDETELFSIVKLRGKTKRSLPQIVVDGRHLRDIADDAQNALIQANQPERFFLRGEALTRVTSGKELKAEAFTEKTLKSYLERAADFVKLQKRPVKDANGQLVKDANGATETEMVALPARVPADLPADLLSRTDDLPFPKLEALAQTPIYAPNRELVMKNGFDKTTGFYLRLANLSGVRCDMPLEEAKQLLLEECLGDFLFQNHAGLAHAICAILQPFIRNFIQGATPLYLVEAPTRGSGKGMFCDVVYIISSGEVAGVMYLPRDGAELEKRITAALLDGARVLMMDNVTTLEGEALAAVLTARQWKGRILGRSQMVTVPNDATWIATGNNVTLDDDMPRRIIPIRLDPQMERPETRDGFRHPDLRGWCKDNRTALVSACLSIVEAWRKAGCPMGKKRLGTYESWSEIMGGILEVAKIESFLEGREYLYSDSNQEPDEWATVLRSIYLERGGLAFNAREFFTTAKTQGALLDYWGNQNEQAATKKIGHAMKKHRDRVLGGYRLRIAGTDSHAKSNLYRVEEVAGVEKNTRTSPQIENQSVLNSLDSAGMCFNIPAEYPRRNTNIPARTP